VSVPDYISPIIAYRVWQWDSLGLKSLNGEQWFPNHALEANSSRCGKEHPVPTDSCACGVYAAKDLPHLQGIGYDRYGVHGEVYLWGKLVEHRLGWRAQFAYPKSLFLPPDTIPFKMSEAESRLETLRLYGADISIASATSTDAPIPLWSKHSGLDMMGLDWLMEKRKRWYLYAEPDHTLKPGDRVAVLGKGIGVVVSADTSDVLVLMWNKLTLRIPRGRVAWSRQNWRWESDTAGIVASVGRDRRPVCKNGFSISRSATVQHRGR
jgi:hypothetical protein